jgi:invasion protein IalB
MMAWMDIDQGNGNLPMQGGRKCGPWLLAGAVLLALSSAATAQQPRPPAPPVPAQPAPLAPAQPAPTEVPQRTTASYANWVLTCDTQAGPPPQKTCEILQVVQAQAQGRTVPFSRIAVMHPVKGQPIKLVVQVPTNVTLNRNVRIQIADADPGIAAPFARCAPIGCLADFELKDDVLQKFRAASSGNGKVTYADVAGHEVVVPLSFSGFSQAFDALAKEMTTAAH